MNTNRRLIIGLGNPGAQFEHTYHNVGALALEAMIGQPLPKLKKYKKLFAYAEMPSSVFVWPLTFMNESGIAVKEAVKKFDVSVGHIFVLHDDSDLTMGTFKISAGKNSAGHNGVQSIIDHLGTNAFTRIRIGIRPSSETKRKKASDFVLARITPTDETTLETIFKKINLLK